MNVKEILKQQGFRFNKQFGQNFLTDAQLLQEIVQDAGVAGATVLEVGAGAGTLTRQLAAVAQKVVAFEIDKNLQSVLNVTLFGCNNVQLIFGDVMKYPMSQLEDMCGQDYSVVANIPYYITSPLIMNFVEGAHRWKSLTLTVQKEVAERICATPATKQYGALTVGIDAVADAKITRILPAEMFYPQPKVDSAVVTITANRGKHNIADHALFRKTVRCAFAMRRKTLANNLSKGFGISRQQAEQLLEQCNLQPQCRGEQLSTSQFVQLCNCIAQSTGEKNV